MLKIIGWIEGTMNRLFWCMIDPFSGLKPSCYRSLKWINISIIAFTIIKRENNLKFKECEICSQLPKLQAFWCLSSIFNFVIILVCKSLELRSVSLRVYLAFSFLWTCQTNVLCSYSMYKYSSHVICQNITTLFDNTLECTFQEFE